MDSILGQFAPKTRFDRNKGWVASGCDTFKMARRNTGVVPTVRFGSVSPFNQGYQVIPELAANFYE